METTNLPTKVNYSRKDVENLASEEQWRDGAVVQVVIEKVTPKSKPAQPPREGEDLILGFMFSVVDPSTGTTKIKQPAIWANLKMPFSHPDFEAHKPHPYAGSFWRQFCRAFLSERHSLPPQRIEGVLMYEGEAIEQADIDIINVKLSEAIMDEAVVQWEGQGQELVGMSAYATIKHSGNFINLNNMRAELVDENLTPKEDLKELKPLNLG